MRNGLSIATVSELRHEVEADVRQAPFVYNVQAEWTKNRSYSVNTASAVIGSIRVPRSFNVLLSTEFTKGRKASEKEWHPVELALIGLGGCVMATYMMGCTTKGIAITDFSVGVGANFSPTGGAAGYLADIFYNVLVESDGSVGQHSEIVRLVSQFSPNHRTIVEQNSIHVTADGYENDVKSADISRAEKHMLANSVELNLLLSWQYAFQMSARAVGFNEGSVPFRVDQPKQAAGIDVGMNPQECLLAGWAGSVLQIFIELCQENHVSVSNASVSATGTVDVRGILGVDPSIPVKVQRIEISLRGCLAETGDKYLYELFNNAVRASPITDVIVSSCPIKVSLCSGGQNVCEFRSDG